MGRYSNLGETGVAIAAARDRATSEQRIEPWVEPQISRDVRVRRRLEEQRDALVADYLSGMGSVVLARKYEISDSTVIKHLKAAGVQMRTGEKLTTEDMVEVRRLRDEGWTQQQIADRFGVTRSTVSIRLSREICR